jgi:two-component sensor histidine kinase
MPEQPRIRVLIVDDDALVCDVIEEELVGQEYRVAAKGFDGQHAIALVASEAPDVILMDIEMPGLNGLAAAERILADHSVPIILLTAHDYTPYVEDASRIGVSGYLLKPPRGRELDRAITIAIARHKDMAEMRRLRATAESLLRELQHRVKNNLNMVSSILSIELPNLPDAVSKKIFTDVQGRIKAMSLLYEQLYSTDEVTRTPLRSYVTNLARGLVESYRLPQQRFGLTITIDEVNLDLKRAIPLGLILNELITNSVKYAFPDRTEGTIDVKIGVEGGMIKVRVGDNGVGIPDGVVLGKTGNMGMKLIDVLGKQIDGEATLRNDGGTIYELAFPLIPG